jgi:hypothetical protein
VSDVLVTLRFYEKGQLFFGNASVAIFIVAQFAYTFFFVGTWAAHHNARQKIATFLLVLPFGQFIPIFTWLESFHFPIIDSILKRFLLTPTASHVLSVDGTNSDSLWSYIQTKVHFVASPFSNFQDADD